MNLRKLAALLELSQTTVSRALNGFPEVGEETRQRVLEAARQHKYRPNNRARALATGRAMAIGHVIPLSSHHQMVNPIFADFLAGAGETYSKADYDLILSIVPDTEEADTYRKLKARRAVDGVIIHNPMVNDPRIALLHQIGLPFVVHGRASGATLPYSWLDVNNRRAFEQATGYLLDLGHRRIALVNGDEAMDFAHRRRLGYEAAHIARDMAIDQELLWSEEMTESYGHRIAAALLSHRSPPTAFLTASLVTAIGVRRAVEERGLHIGRDVSIVTHDDVLAYFSNDKEGPLFTATRASVRDAGRLAAEMLLDQIARPNAPVRERIIEAKLLIGRSTGPAPSGFA